MKIGLQIDYFSWPGSPDNIGAKLAEIARVAEDAGLDSLWVMDHFFDLMESDTKVGSIPDEPMLEGYSTISFLAGVTNKVKVGLLVTGNIYRHPGILVKTVTTLDVLSGGRACFGIGAGWYEREAKGLGVPFPSLRERFERLEETLQITKHMWSGDASPFKGRHYQLDEPINSPQPLTKPHPPILIGGGGEKKTLRLVAKYGDACNLYLNRFLGRITQPDFKQFEEAMARKFGLLRSYCDEIGRSYNEIERTGLCSIKIGPDALNSAQVVALCGEFASVGIQHVIFNMPNMHEIEPLRIIGEEVVPQVEDI